MKKFVFVLVLGLMSIASYGGESPPQAEILFFKKSMEKHTVQNCTEVSSTIHNLRKDVAAVTLTAEQKSQNAFDFPVPKGCRSEVSQEPTFRMALYRHHLSTNFLYKNDLPVLPVLRLPDGMVMNC